MDKQERIWELVSRKATGDLNESELQELSDLLETAGENISYMLSVMDYYWESVHSAPESEEVLSIGLQQKEKAIKQVRKDSETQLKMRKRHSVYYWIWAAAILLCIVGGGFIYYSLVEYATEMNEVTTNNGSRTKVTLPDGTTVLLNVGSKLSYPNDFQHITNREVTLSGEAYFDVVHDPDRPFIIHTSYLDITDLGTVFNVKDYPGDQQAEATLISGSIEVALRKKPARKLVLEPHEKVSYYADTKDLSLKKEESRLSGKRESKELKTIARPARLEVTKIQPVINPGKDTILTEIAWTKNQLVFRSESFMVLAARMERWYNVKIDFLSEEVKDYTFTGIFEGETLEQAMSELQMIRPFHYQIKKDRVIISQ